jgi:nucleotide-binding universal stress UspA family protein
MLDHILVPLDGTEIAEAALKYAVHIVSPDGKITILAVVDVPRHQAYGIEPKTVIAWELYRSDVAEKKAYTRIYINQAIERLQFTSFEIEAVIKVGHYPALVITELAHNLSVAAIVIASRQRSRIKRWLFGCINNEVLNTASCPVIIVPDRLGDREQKREPLKLKARRSEVQGQMGKFHGDNPLRRTHG